jgi:tellurite resistance protein TehA-like permease
LPIVLCGLLVGLYSWLLRLLRQTLEYNYIANCFVRVLSWALFLVIAVVAADPYIANCFVRVCGLCYDADLSRTE